MPRRHLLVRPAPPFYDRLNRLLDECDFDEFVEGWCERFYAKTLGRPGPAPGIYLRLLMIGYFRRHRQRAWDGVACCGLAGNPIASFSFIS